VWQTDREQTVWQTDRETDSVTDRQRDRQCDRQTERQTVWQTDRETESRQCDRQCESIRVKPVSVCQGRWQWIDERDHVSQLNLDCVYTSHVAARLQTASTSSSSSSSSSRASTVPQHIKTSAAADMILMSVTDEADFFSSTQAYWVTAGRCHNASPKQVLHYGLTSLRPHIWG